MIGNLDPALRSSLEAINLISLFSSDLLATYSFDDILRPFIEDLKELNAVSSEFIYLYFFYIFFLNFKDWWVACNY